MTLAFVLVTAVAVGFMSGLRAFTPIAVVSWLAIWGWMPLAGSPFWFLGRTLCATALSIFAFAELIGDKLPKTAARTKTAPLFARMVAGATSAAAVCIAGGQAWALGIFLGAFGSVLGAFGGFHVRRFVVQRLHAPDLLVALAEDFVAVAGTLTLLRYFFAKPI